MTFQWNKGNIHVPVSPRILCWIEQQTDKRNRHCEHIFFQGHVHRCSRKPVQKHIDTRKYNQVWFWKHVHGWSRKRVHGRVYWEYGRARNHVSYIPTKGTGVNRVTSMADSMVKTFVRGIMNAYDDYRRYEPLRDIGTDVVGKVRKGIRYADTLHQGS